MKNLVIGAMCFLGCGGESQLTVQDGSILPDVLQLGDAAPEVGPDALVSDSGVDSSDAASLPLPAIPDAIVWLEGDLGTSLGPVATWVDQSGSGNNATQQSPQSQPSLIANGLNGLPIVRLNGSSYLSLPPGFSDFTKGLSAFVVVKPSVVPHPANMAARFLDFAPNYGLLSDSILFVRYWPNGQDLLMYQVYAGASPGPNVAAANAIVDDAWQELSVVEAGGAAGTNANATLYKNGTSVANSSVLVPNVVTRQSNLIGKSNLGADPLFKGDLAAIVVFKRELLPTERQMMDAYLKKKWAL